MPSYTAVPFLVTAPVINPIVLFATYSAFEIPSNGSASCLRFYGSGHRFRDLLGFFADSNIQKETARLFMSMTFHISAKDKSFSGLVQAIDEFFDTGRYLVFGCLFASLVQVHVPTRILTSISSTPAVAILLLMLLSFLLSLCEMKLMLLSELLDC